MTGNLDEHLKVIQALHQMHDIEDDAAKKARIRSAARDLVDVALPKVEEYVISVVADDI